MFRRQCVLVPAVLVGLVWAGVARGQFGQRGGFPGHLHGGHTPGGPGAGCPLPLPVPLPLILPYYYPQPVPYPYPVPVIPEPVPLPMGRPPVPLPGQPALSIPVREAPRPERRQSNRDAERFELMMTYGDRLFRASNLGRAEERYEQAIEADPSAAVPRIRLAQIALRRGRYAEAADRIREGLTAEPSFLINAPDLRSLFAEPNDLPRLIGELESHLQANPNDRDAWLVLGAEKYLSGRTREAADIFLRLTDRKPDETLAAFLDATGAAPKTRR